MAVEKTEDLYWPLPQVHTVLLRLGSMAPTSINAVERFAYLGSVISSDTAVSKDLDNRLSKPSNSSGRMSKRVWQSQSLHLCTKIQVYRIVVVPTLLYGAETWVLYRKQLRVLERFHKRRLRSILGIKCQDHVLDEEVFKRASLPKVDSILLQVQLH